MSADVCEPKDVAKSKSKDKEAVAEDDAKVDVVKEARLAIRFILYPIGALLLLVAAQSRYRPQRVEMPEPVSISRLTEPPGDTSQ